MHTCRAIVPQSHLHEQRGCLAPLQPDRLSLVPSLPVARSPAGYTASLCQTNSGFPKRS